MCVLIFSFIYLHQYKNKISNKTSKHSADLKTRSRTADGSVQRWRRQRWSRVSAQPGPTALPAPRCCWVSSLISGQVADRKQQPSPTNKNNNNNKVEERTVVICQGLLLVKAAPENRHQPGRNSNQPSLGEEFTENNYRS